MENPMEKLEARIKERIKGDLNELIDDEDIQALIQKALQEAFFEPRVEADPSSFSYRQITKPPRIVELVMEATREQIKEAAVIWMREHNEEVEKALRDFLERKPGEILMSAIGAILGGQVYQLQSSFAEQLKAALGKPL